MTTTEVATECPVLELCTVCHKPDDEEHKKFHHAFSPPGGKTRGLQKKSDAEQVMAPPSNGALRKLPPGDPVLRLALIRLGVVTVQQIEEIEAELRATGMAFGEPPTSLAQP